MHFITSFKSSCTQKFERLVNTIPNIWSTELRTEGREKIGCSAYLATMYCVDFRKVIKSHWKTSLVVLVRENCSEKVYNICKLYRFNFLIREAWAWMGKKKLFGYPFLVKLCLVFHSLRKNCFFLSPKAVDICVLVWHRWLENLVKWLELTIFKDWLIYQNKIFWRKTNIYWMKVE